MDGVGLARGALLAFVLLEAELPGLADDLKVVAGAVLVDLVEEVGKFLVDFGYERGTGPGEVFGGAFFGG